jgi:hypothetical protein
MVFLHRGTDFTGAIGVFAMPKVIKGLTPNMLNYLNRLVQLPFSDLSIINFMNIKMKICILSADKPVRTAQTCSRPGSSLVAKAYHFWV